MAPHGMAGVDACGHLGAGGIPLVAQAVSLWGTPRVESTKPIRDAETVAAYQGKANSGAAGRIEDQVAIWATPTSHERTHTARPVHHGEQLANQVEGVWATPNALGGTGYLSGSNRDTWRPTLEGQAQGKAATLHSPRPARATGRRGPWSSPEARIWRLRFRGWIAWRSPAWLRRWKARRTKRLNPAFVCWLMGWPWFWTHPGLTSSGPAATEFTRWLLASRSALSGLLSASEACRERGLFDSCD
jgi:hypothetical protein